MTPLPLYGTFLLIGLTTGPVSAEVQESKLSFSLKGDPRPSHSSPLRGVESSQRATVNTQPPRVGSGPQPVVASDTTFLIDQGVTLDTSCRFRDEEPITIEIPMTRVVGEVNNNGHLLNSQQLIAKGVVSAKATLRIPMYDIDLPDEVDEVEFNGVPLAQLTGADETWRINTCQVPIDQVKFPTPPSILPNIPSPAVPSPAMNQVVIKIDTASSTPSWCTSMDWAALSFKAVSPVILMHGLAAP